jgi:NAD(P)-dependent dehydrogenase (short-subunit alcohol dehydrogenase family)
MKSVLIIGGYGGFGARLSKRLAKAGWKVLVAGRRLDAATTFCATLPGSVPIEANRNGELGPLLSDLKPDLVVDAAGPF